MFTRPNIIMVAMILIAAFTSCREQKADSLLFEAGDDPYLARIATDLYKVENINNGGNVCFLVSRRGVLIVDAGYYPSGSRKVVDLIGRLTSKPVRYVVLTHCHTDHVGGIGGYPEDATIIGHSNLKSNIDRFVKPGIDSFREELEKYGEDSLRLRLGDLFDDRFNMVVKYPDIEFEEQYSVDLGNYTVDLTYAGPCHTTDNIYVLFREQKALHTGDLVFNGRHPFVSSAYGADPESWGRSVREWSTRDIEVVVPGHGETGGVEILSAQADYFDTLIRAAAEYNDSDMTVNDIAREIDEKYFPEIEFGSYFSSAIELLLSDRSE